ncbi:hypothetical protein RchiOBHm_Chr1g0350071 [Rosa chinensis]|uniref:Uncharacterized protein n=1 Tax=Rosa chinensis TaxID=74649 RepID=A0A2P6SFY9_ROSCH|nr:hypothetical protein RchiOBHm_Chr1g0350071 [Rosa chinensis]
MLAHQKRDCLLAKVGRSQTRLICFFFFFRVDDTNQETEEVHRLFRSTASDCIVEDRSSFVAFQANTGVEVCTFRLVVKNATSLLGDKDPLKLEAESMLNDLIR